MRSTPVRAGTGAKGFGSADPGWVPGPALSSNWPLGPRSSMLNSGGPANTPTIATGALDAPVAAVAPFVRVELGVLAGPAAPTRSAVPGARASPPVPSPLNGTIVAGALWDVPRSWNDWPASWYV